MLPVDRRVSSPGRLFPSAVTFILTLGWAALALAQATDFPNRKDPLQGITSAGQPSAEQLSAAAAEGYKTVIDLRTAAEDRGMDEEGTVEKLGMSYVNLPIGGGGDITYANATALDKLIANAKGPVLIHCGSGNRVGALLALRAKENGVDTDTALALGVAAGVTGLKGTVEKKLEAGHD
jgi:uncharacterized protein (TIGR01244 family)